MIILPLPPCSILIKMNSRLNEDIVIQVSCHKNGYQTSYRALQHHPIFTHLLTKEFLGILGVSKRNVPIGQKTEPKGKGDRISSSNYE
jgi:hypothetical protein